MDISVVVSVVSALVAIGAVAVAVSQARYARDQARAAVRQTEIQEQIRRDAAQPYVWVDFRPDPMSAFFIDIVIQNDGPTVARDIRVSFVPPLQSAAFDHNRDEAPALFDGIASMPPGRQLVWSFDSAPQRFESDLPRQYEVTIVGKGPFGPLEPLVYTLSLTDYEGTEARTHPLKAIAKELEEIPKALKAMAPPPTIIRR